MFCYNRTNLISGIDLANWFFNHGFKFQDSVSNGCRDLLMLCDNIIIFLLSLLKELVMVVLFMTLANMKQFVC